MPFRYMFRNFTFAIFYTDFGYQNHYEPFELPHDKTNKVACAPSEDADQPGHSPSLISLCCALNG